MHQVNILHIGIVTFALIDNTCMRHGGGQNVPQAVALLIVEWRQHLSWSIGKCKNYANRNNGKTPIMHRIGPINALRVCNHVKHVFNITPCIRSLSGFANGGNNWIDNLTTHYMLPTTAFVNTHKVNAPHANKSPRVGTHTIACEACYVHNMTAGGFEPTHPNIVDVESTALCRSAKPWMQWIWFCKLRCIEKWRLHSTSWICCDVHS